MKLYTTLKNGIFEISTRKLRIDLSNTSKENPKEIPDEIGKEFLNGGTGVIFEVKPTEHTKKNKEGNDTTKQVKVPLRSDIEALNGKKRYELYKLAKEKGFEDNFIGSTKEKLIKFLKGK